jgi:RNA polymerase sigma-70 factor (ECF subfamily)
VERAISAVRGGAAGPAREPAAPSPELEALAGETRDEVRAALGRLRDEERLVVTCRFLLDLSEAETAAALGLPAGTVKSRLHRALRRLRADLEPHAAAAEATR